MLQIHAVRMNDRGRYLLKKHATSLTGRLESESEIICKVAHPNRTLRIVSLYLLPCAGSFGLTGFNQYLLIDDIITEILWHETRSYKGLTSSGNDATYAHAVSAKKRIALRGDWKRFAERAEIAVRGILTTGIRRKSGMHLTYLEWYGLTERKTNALIGCIIKRERWSRERDGWLSALEISRIARRDNRARDTCCVAPCI